MYFDEYSIYIYIYIHYIILYYIISYHIILYYIMLCYLISYHIISYYIILYYVISYYTYMYICVCYILCHIIYIYIYISYIYIYIQLYTYTCVCVCVTLCIFIKTVILQCCNTYTVVSSFPLRSLTMFHISHMFHCFTCFVSTWSPSVAFLRAHRPLTVASTRIVKQATASMTIRISQNEHVSTMQHYVVSLCHDDTSSPLRHAKALFSLGRRSHKQCCEPGED